MIDWLMRAVAFAGGLYILIFAANISETQAATIALGSLVLGYSCHSGRWLAAALAVMLLANEAYNFLVTADAHVIASEAQSAPIHDAAAKRKAAEAWLARLEGDDRVQRAERALQAARTDANARSTDKGCGPSCKATLVKTVDDAGAQVESARQSLEIETRQARTAIDKAPLPGSPTPFADKIGMAPWALDLLRAILKSIGNNGVAACLLAFAAHRKRAELAALVPETSAPAKPVATVADYVASRIVATKGATVPFRDVYLDYEAWCGGLGAPAFAPGSFGEQLAHECQGIAVSTRKRNGVLHLVGVRIANRVALIEARAS